MAEGEHVALLKQGVAAWNQWRWSNPKIRPSLFGASLRGADLLWADLREADLSYATLFGAKLRGANLFSADLRQTDLRDAEYREPLLRRVPSGHSGQTPAPR